MPVFRSPIVLLADPSIAMQAATKQYVDSKALISSVWSYQGAVMVVTGKSRWYADRAYTIKKVRASVNTAPTGSALIVDVNKNGTTVYTTQGDRPTIAVSTNTDEANTIDVSSVAAGDYLTVDIDQIGSTVAGADLTVQVFLEPA